MTAGPSRDARQGRVLWKGSRMAHGLAFARDAEGRSRLVFPLLKEVWRLDLVGGHFERLLSTEDKVALVREAGPGRLVLAAARADRERVEEALAGFGRRVGEVMDDDRIVVRVPDATDDAEGLDKASHTIIEVSIGDAVAAFTGGGA